MAKIKVRLNPLSEKEVFLEYSPKRKLISYFNEVVEKYPNRKDLKDYFKIFIDGHEVRKEFWEFANPKENHVVMIAMVPRNDQMLGQALVLAAVIAVTVYTPIGPAAGEWTAGSAFALRAGVAIGATLLVNSLIPPPNLGLSPFSASQYQDSQMFSITSQSNSVSKYGSVPKVYGTHKMFPYIVANQYISLETDPRTKELVQYLYAIYDFGLGPALISDIKIGDTLISDFLETIETDNGGISVSSVKYRLVDLNKPLVDEGAWDSYLSNTFEIYKGDVTQSDISVTINKNENDVAVTVADYQSTKNATTNTRNERQEISLSIAFPQGLTSFYSNGTREERVVELQIEFAEIGSNTWYSYDDITQVDEFDNDDIVYDNTYTPDGEWDRNFGLGFGCPIGINLNSGGGTLPISTILVALGYTSGSITPSYHDVFLYDAYFGNQDNLEESFIYPAGRDPVYTNWPVGNYVIYKLPVFIKKDYTSQLIFPNLFRIGSYVYVNGEYIGTILTRTPDGGNYLYTITAAQKNITLFHEYIRVNLDPPGTVVSYFGTYLGLGNVIPLSEFSFFEIRDPDGLRVIVGNQQTPMYASVRFIPKSQESLKIRLTRKRSYGGGTYQINDSLVWLYLTTKFDTNPIVTEKRHVFMELKMKATDQLNGAIQNLSGVVTSVLDAWDEDTQTWIKKPTSNPAWIFSDILTGEVNKRAIAKTRLDTDSLLEWANYCDEIPSAPTNIDAYIMPRYLCNFILDYNITLNDLINQVSSSAQASLNLINGKYGVLLDVAKTVPVQMFTPRNSREFSSNRKYLNVPHALKIKYVEPGSNWEVREKTVYQDGYDTNTATTFEDMDSFGITNNEQAYRYGRYMMAQGLLRQENMTITVDFEHLVCTRGDYVVISQDVMSVGGTPARVKSVSGITIEIDTDFAPGMGSYGYTFRSKTGNITTSTMTILTPSTADVDGDIPEVGDLIVWGEVGQITFDCIVKAIIPNDDLSAQLVLVEKNDAIFDAESSDVIPDYDALISTIQDFNVSPPNAVEDLTVDDNTWECDGSSYRYYVNLSWSIPAGTIYEVFEIYRDFGTGYSIDGFTQKLEYKFIVDQDNLGLVHNFKVLAVSATGSKISLGNAIATSATPLIKTDPPSDVEALYINITNQVIQFEFPLVSDCEIFGYSLRYSPNLDGTWASSIPLLKVDRNTSTPQVQGRVGSYFVKAVDFNGNESVNAAMAITSIPNLFDLNIIEETNDFPTFPGSLSLVDDFGGTLLISESVSGGPGITQYYPEGEYYYENFLDLGDIYTVRLQSLVEAEGYTIDDLMSSWTTLSSVTAMSTVSVSDWDVETYFRSRDSIVVMADWVTLDTVTTLATGAEADWPAWKKFTIGDFTSRIFQFKLKLKSLLASVSPRVLDGEIRADMPDRTESYNNLSAPDTGLTVTYTPSFKGPGSSPAIQITQDDASQGDYYKITSRTLDSFDIQFFDKDDIAVARTFDAMVKGYGYKNDATI